MGRELVLFRMVSDEINLRGEWVCWVHGYGTNVLK